MGRTGALGGHLSVSPAQHRAKKLRCPRHAAHTGGKVLARAQAAPVGLYPTFFVMAFGLQGWPESCEGSRSGCGWVRGASGAVWGMELGFGVTGSLHAQQSGQRGGIAPR